MTTTSFDRFLDDSYPPESDDDVNHKTNAVRHHQTIGSYSIKPFQNGYVLSHKFGTMSLLLASKEAEASFLRFVEDHEFHYFDRDDLDEGFKRGWMRWTSVGLSHRR